jgi:putative acetyltransferase
MLEIIPLLPDQTAEARRVIYTVAYHLFHDHDTLEATIANYETTWPLADVIDFQHSYVDNGGIFLVIRDGETIVGTGALRRLEERVGEIKRVWLLPEYQGQGWGYRMMQQLLAVAREKGYQKVRLETNPIYQPGAFAFYRKLGFYEIPRYGDDLDDVGMEFVL